MDMKRKVSMNSTQKKGKMHNKPLLLLAQVMNQKLMMQIGYLGFANSIYQVDAKKLLKLVGLPILICRKRVKKCANYIFKEIADSTTRHVEKSMI